VIWLMWCRNCRHGTAWQSRDAAEAAARGHRRYLDLVLPTPAPHEVWITEIDVQVQDPHKLITPEEELG
jgi:hypothetical protein